MQLRHWIGTLAVVGLTVAPAAAFGQTPAVKVDDGTLKDKIETRIKASPTLKDDNIDIAVDNGVVTLTGSVDTKAESTVAAQLAKIGGISKVENKLDIHADMSDKAAATTGKVESKTEKAVDKTESAAKKTGDKIEDGSKKVAAKTKDAAGEVGEAVTDAWITTKLKADFVNEEPLKGSSINVDTNDHVVTLKGTVTSTAGRARAIEIAKTTKGVSRVIDNLTIAPK